MLRFQTDPLAALMGGGGGAPPGPAGPMASAGPAPEITIPPDPASGGGGSDDPSALVTEAKDLLRRALDSEPDHEDKLLLEKMLTEAQQYLAAQQKMTDTAMGAGPGTKMIRKASGGGGGY